MMTRQRGPARGHHAHPALTLVEMVISIVLVSVMLAAAAATVGAAKQGQRRLGDEITGQQLAQDLMTEILEADFADPAAGRDSFGLEGEDVGDGSRALFDDVDDYDGWIQGPPQSKDGTTMGSLAGWERTVLVKWVDPLDITRAVISPQIAKLITVQVSHGGVPAAQLSAIKGSGPTATEACCFGDGTSLDLPPDVCTTLGGTPLGVGTSTLTSSCATPAIVLLVVSDATIPTDQDKTRQAVIESFGFEVMLIDDNATQADFDAAVAASDVAYVSEEITSTALGTKLREAPIGIVIEEEKSHDEFGLSSSEMTFTGDSIDITDTSHYITSPFSIGLVAFAATPQPVGAPNGDLAPGLYRLALRPSSSNGMIDVIDQGAPLYGGGTAAGRRVKLPWGGNDFDINSLTADGRTIMHRAIEWGAGEGDNGGPVMLVADINMGSRVQGKWRYGQATIWIQTDAGLDVPGATVTVQWSGAVSGSSQGTTGVDGKVMLEAPFAQSGNTVICTITDVVEASHSYNASLNVETTDSIILP